MNYLIFHYFFLVLSAFAMVGAVRAADVFPPYTITIRQEEHARALQPPLQKALQQNRDNLKLSGISMSDSKLARKEIGILAKVLKSEGFYEHTVSYQKINNTIVYTIDAGRPYRIGSYSITSTQEDINLPAPDELGLKPDMQLRAADVLAAHESLDRYLGDHNCLWQSSSAYEVRLNHQDATADIDFLVKPAEQVNLGEITIQGLETVDEAFVRQSLELRPGQCYRSKAIEKTRLHLLQSGLFSVVEARVSPPVDGAVNVNFDLKERHHKTIKVGVGYSTDENVSVTAGWQHRNIFGGAERLDVEGKVSTLFKILESTLIFPSFMHPKQALILEAELADENLEAFDAMGVTLTATLRRRLARYLTVSGGVRYQFRSVQENGNEETFGLLSLPMSLEYDRRDNILDPRKGWVTTLRVQPYADSLNRDILFLKSSIGASIYHTLADVGLSPTLAARTVIGSISGNDTDSIPADVRFYAGGGGSVRGYPFQKLGPLDNGDPSGGRSLLELSLEARLRFTETWGGVVFIDGGNVYDDQFPRFDQGLRWAVGFGARYTTALTPIRLDIAFPVNKRGGIDDTFQLYVSLAQAF